LGCIKKKDANRPRSPYTLPRLLQTSCTATAAAASHPLPPRYAASALDLVCSSSDDGFRARIRRRRNTFTGHGVQVTMRARTARLPRSASSRETLPQSEHLANDHKFAVGQLVRLSLPYFGPARPTESYRIVKLLPRDANEPQYRIKSESESYERVVRESQLHAFA
jgi:hypothetical protein